MVERPVFSLDTFATIQLIPNDYAMIAMCCSTTRCWHWRFSERGRYDIDLQAREMIADGIPIGFLRFAHDTQMLIRFNVPTLRTKNRGCSGQSLQLVVSAHTMSKIFLEKQRSTTLRIPITPLLCIPVLHGEHKTSCGLDFGFRCPKCTESCYITLPHPHLVPRLVIGAIHITKSLRSGCPASARWALSLTFPNGPVASCLLPHDKLTPPSLAPSLLVAPQQVQCRHVSETDPCLILLTLVLQCFRAFTLRPIA